jgi:nucleotide-binding universal stress UspA family protein
MWVREHGATRDRHAHSVQHGPTVGNSNGMTTVLMAIDESQASKRAAEVAAACFGPQATYLAIDVDEQYPVGGPLWGPGLGWGGVNAHPFLRNWFSKLFERSTSDDVLNETDVPVLVVPAGHPDA